MEIEIEGILASNPMRDEKQYQAFRAATVPFLPDEAFVGVFSNGRYKKITATKCDPKRSNKKHGKVIVTYRVPSLKIAKSIREKILAETSSSRSDKILKTKTKIREISDNCLTQFGLVRHPIASRHLWVSQKSPEIPLDWDYSPSKKEQLLLGYTSRSVSKIDLIDLLERVRAD